MIEMEMQDKEQDKELDRFCANDSRLIKSQCADCKYVNGWNCYKLKSVRPDDYVKNEKDCPHRET